MGSGTISRGMVVTRADRHGSAREFPDEPEMWVTHETIYQSLYVQGRGELRRELPHCAPAGRFAVPGPGPSGAGRIPDMVSISSDPPRPPTGPCPATGKAI